MRRGKVSFVLSEVLLFLLLLLIFLTLAGLKPRYFLDYRLEEDQLIPTVKEEYPGAAACAQWNIGENQLVLFQLDGIQCYVFFERFPLNGKFRPPYQPAASFQMPIVRDFTSAYRLDLTGDVPIILERMPHSGLMFRPAGLGALAALLLALFFVQLYLRRGRGRTDPRRSDQ